MNNWKKEVSHLDQVLTEQLEVNEEENFEQMLSMHKQVRTQLNLVKAASPVSDAHRLNECE